jgi:hypothetical protein
MKASHIHQFVDNKIRMAYQKNRSIDDVIDDLNNRVSDPMRNLNNFRAYIAVFSRKRIGDINFLSDKVHIDGPLGATKLINLLKLRDKLQGFTDFEIKSSEKNFIENE